MKLSVVAVAALYNFESLSDFAKIVPMSMPACVSLTSIVVP